jgi:magnesium transporter
LGQLFDRHAFFGLPVVDEAGKLVGIVEKADFEEARGESAERTFLRFGGIVGGEELRSMPVGLRAARRLSFLTPNILLNILSSSVIAFYEGTLQQVIALAVFLPILSDMSGCAGNQAVAVSIRELSLGVIKPRDFARVWWQEARIGIPNGIALGVLLAGVAYLWKGTPYLAGVVGIAMAINTLVAVSMGGLIPLGLRAVKLDPALAAAPILTTVTDMCGFFLSLSFAAAALRAGKL